MNTKILASLLIIGLVASTVGLGTYAYFSDVEKSEGNTLMAGTIDIAVDGENPWESTYDGELDDLKPCMWRYIEFKIRNVGSNPVVLWKHFDVTGTNTGDVTEPECEAEGGTWITPEPGQGEPYCEGNTPIDDIHNMITYDLKICWDMNEDQVIDREEECVVVFAEEDHIKIGVIESMWMPLGTLEPSEEILVIQSYHLQAEAGNEYQGDVMEFTIELYGEQLNAPGPSESPNQRLFLENKDANWNAIPDGTWGILDYTDGTEEFGYDLTAQGLQASTNYCLIYYADPWPGNNPGAEIACDTTLADGSLAMIGSTELNMDLPDPSDDNYPVGAKIWLVLQSDWDGSKMTGWDPTNYLFEGNKITYDDSGVP